MRRVVIMNRRQFVTTTTLSAGAAAIAPLGVTRAAETTSGVRWPIGCFNRPWTGGKKDWGLDAAFDGIRQAGYKLTGLLSRTPNDPLTGSDATAEYLARLKERIAARGLKANMAALRNKNEVPLDEQIKDT